MAFTYPDAFWLLALAPILAVLLLIAGIGAGRARTRFARPELISFLSRSVSTPKRFAGGLLYLIGIIFLVLALSGPRFGTRTEIVTRMGVDVVIALDTSYSMLAEDVKPNRIIQSKYEINRLIDNLQGDRIALIAFSGDAIIQCPLTTDYSAAKTFLEYIDVGVVPSPGTDIEKAVQAAIKLFDDGAAAGGEGRMIILATDGESISGDPVRAAKDAARQGIRIFPVGIGTIGGEIIPIRDDEGQLTDYKRDSKGELVKSSLDEKSLRSVADAAGGAYVRAENGEVDIQSIIDELGTMHRADIHERKISRLRERYQIPLGISLMCFTLWLFIGDRRGGLWRKHSVVEDDTHAQ